MSSHRVPSVPTPKPFIQRGGPAYRTTVPLRDQPMPTRRPTWQPPGTRIPGVAAVVGRDGVTPEWLAATQ